jgi:modulator of FtsH protease
LDAPPSVGIRATKARWRNRHKADTLSALNPPSISDWNTLLSVEAGAAATLTGLVFVAVSINLNRIMSFPGLPGRAAESILQFLEVFLICTVALVPRQSGQSLATEILTIGLILWGCQVATQIQYLRKRTGHPWAWFIYRAVLGQCATVPFLIAGVELLLGVPTALYWMVPGFIFSFAAGVLSSWVLLVEVVR